MGLLIGGKWVDQWYDTRATKGEFKRQESAFRNWVTKDGSAGPAGRAGYVAEAGRYCLYVSLACPWAHRTLIFRSLKGLSELIDVIVVNPVMQEKGWKLNDSLYGMRYLYELYLKADSSYEGRVTVPVLWDKKTATIVSNESADIIRMFNSVFNGLTNNEDDYYPASKHEEIDELNEYIYHHINNGVYRAGFATTHAAYERAFLDVFDALDKLELKLQEQDYLVGNEITEADWRLFTTLIRFDAVYYGHFKTNKKRIADYPNLSDYVRRLYRHPGIVDTVNFKHIKTHYYVSHTTINPTGIVPAGPELGYL